MKRGLLVSLFGAFTLLLLAGTFPAGEYGLFSRSFFNFDHFKCYSFINALAVRVTPPTINADGRYWNDPMMPDFPLPDDFRHVPESSLDIVRAAIKHRVDAFVDATAVNALGTSAPIELQGAYLR